MADTSPLAGLLDRAGNVFSLAGQLGRAFREEHGTAGGFRQIDPTGWDRHQPAFKEFCAAVLDLCDAMQNPPDGFAPVANALRKAAGVAKQIRDAMGTPHGHTEASYLGCCSLAFSEPQGLRDGTRWRRLRLEVTFVPLATS
jgi:hypothetical protein